MHFDPERVQANIRQASTDDLLDRATVFRPGMEPEALRMIEDELRQRGLSAEGIEAHGARRSQETIALGDGTAARCGFCHRPAVGEGWGWHRLWGVLPLFPRYFYYCAVHQPAAKVPAASAE